MLLLLRNHPPSSRACAPPNSRRSRSQSLTLTFLYLVFKEPTIQRRQIPAVISQCLRPPSVAPPSSGGRRTIGQFGFGCQPPCLRHRGELAFASAPEGSLPTLFVKAPLPPPLFALRCPVQPTAPFSYSTPSTPALSTPCHLPATPRSHARAFNRPSLAVIPARGTKLTTGRRRASAPPHPRAR